MWPVPTKARGSPTHVPHGAVLPGRDVGVKPMHPLPQGRCHGSLSLVKCGSGTTPPPHDMEQGPLAAFSRGAGACSPGEGAGGELCFAARRRATQRWARPSASAAQGLCQGVSLA